MQLMIEAMDVRYLFAYFLLELRTPPCLPDITLAP